MDLWKSLWLQKTIYADMKKGKERVKFRLYMSESLDKRAVQRREITHSTKHNITIALNCSQNKTGLSIHLSNDSSSF